MIEELNLVLSVLLSMFGIILLIVLLILGIRLIQVLNKVDRVVDNVEHKVNSFNGLFEIIDSTTDSLVMMTDKVSGAFSWIISKIFNSKNKKEEDYE